MCPCIFEDAAKSSVAVARNTAALPEGNISFAFLSSADMPQTIGFVIVDVRAGAQRGAGAIHLCAAVKGCSEIYENNTAPQNVNICLSQEDFVERRTKTKCEVFSQRGERKKD